MFDEIVKGALSLAGECPCEEGCPSCVGPAIETGEGGKDGAVALLKLLAGR